MTNNVILTADWHFGNGKDSVEHNENLLEFIEFLAQKSEEHDAKAVIIAGDYFHDRNKIDVQTLNYAIQGAKNLRDDPRIPEVHVLVGNHDLYQRYTRDVSSLESIESYLNVHYKASVLDKFNLALIPWLSNEDDHREMNELMGQHDVKFCIGHFEFNGFRMNKNYIMDQGDDFTDLPWYDRVKKIFTGHYHARQDYGKICYLGTPFPYDFNDANDFDRGLCVLDVDSGDYFFENWEKIKILNVDLETYHEIKDAVDENTRISVDLGEDFDFESMDSLQKELEEHGVHDYKIKYETRKHHQEEVDVEEVGNVDEFVLNYIEKADFGDDFDRSLMKEIYKEILE